MRALGADEIDWAAIIAAGHDSVDMGETEPHLLKLTINDLVTLDELWSKQDDNHRSTELIDGRIYHRPARYRQRWRVVMDLYAALRSAAEKLTNAPHVGMRGSIAMPPYDLPLPDIVLTYEPHGDGFIPAGSVPLVVEVAESAFDFYMGEKLRCYARMRIAEYWVVDVNRRAIHRIWSPAGDNYSELETFSFGDSIASSALRGITVAAISSLSVL